MACPKVKNGRQCRRPAGHSGLHSFVALKSRGAKSVREADEYAAFRNVLRERSGGECEAYGLRACARTDRHAGSEAHHVWPEDRAKGLHDPARGLWLCATAHGWVHDNPAEAKLYGMLRPSPVDDALTRCADPMLAEAARLFRESRK